MANLKQDDLGRPIPQHQNIAGTDYEALKGTNYASFVGGDEAHGGADDGYPIKIGGKASATDPVGVDDGDRVNAWFDQKGRLHVTLDEILTTIGEAILTKGLVVVGSDGTNARALKTDSDGHQQVDILTAPGNTSGIALASQPRTESINSGDLVNSNGRGVHVIVDVTAITDTPSITVKIEGKDPASEKYYTILESVAITGTGTTVLKLHPNLTPEQNKTINDILPSTWRVSVTNADADSITYSVGYNIV